MPTLRTGFGDHYLVDLLDCDAERLRRVESVESVVLEAARACRATVIGHIAHQFEPEGASIVVLIAESHISLHSWPEESFAGLDIFTCGTEMDPQIAVDAMAEGFGAGRVRMEVVTRGSIGGAGG